MHSRTLSHRRIGMLVLACLFGCESGGPATTNTSPAGVTPATEPAVPQAASSTPQGARIPAGKLVAAQVRYQFAVYFLPDAIPADPIAEFVATHEAKPSRFRRADQIPDEVTEPVLATKTVDVATSYAPPDA